MTREETISILEESKRQNEIMRDNPSTFWASHQMAEGVKNAKRRIEAFKIALTALRPVSREQVEKVWRGEWIPVCDTVQDVLREFPPYEMLRGYKCSLCGRFEEKQQPFCNCGAPMTDKAVQMVMERLEALKDGSTADKN